MLSTYAKARANFSSLAPTEAEFVYGMPVSSAGQPDITSKLTNCGINLTLSFHTQFVCSQAWHMLNRNCKCPKRRVLNDTKKERQREGGRESEAEREWLRHTSDGDCWCAKGLGGRGVNNGLMQQNNFSTCFQLGLIELPKTKAVRNALAKKDGGQTAVYTHTHTHLHKHTYILWHTLTCPGRQD